MLTEPQTLASSASLTSFAPWRFGLPVRQAHRSRTPAPSAHLPARCGQVLPASAQNPGRPGPRCL